MACLLLPVLAGCSNANWTALPIQSTEGKLDGRPPLIVKKTVVKPAPSSTTGLATAPAPKPAGGNESDAQKRHHKIRKGDTLYSLSKRYDVPLRQLIAANALEPPYVLGLGQVLIIPISAVHLVEAGDTLYSLSRRYGLSVNELSRRNRIKPPYTISVGQLLLLPDTVVSATETVALVKKPETKEASPAETATPKGKVEAKASPKALIAPLPKVGQKVETLKAGNKKTASTKKTAARSSKKKKKQPVKPGGLSFAYPVRGELALKYGDRKNGQRNEGIDIVADEGTPVKASESGVVVYSGSDINAFGNLILIRHKNGFLTAYGHNAKNIAGRGDRVKKGQHIANVGQTGSVGQPQLHFEIRNKDDIFDPLLYLPR